MCLASKYLVEIDSFVERIKVDMEKLNCKQSEYDKKISEIYHKLETMKFNACEGYYISKELQTVLRKRRLIKSEYFRMKHIYDTLLVETVGNKLPKAKKGVKKSNESGKQWESTFGFNFSDIEDEVLN